MAFLIMPAETTLAELKALLAEPGWRDEEIDHFVRVMKAEVPALIAIAEAAYALRNVEPDDPSRPSAYFKRLHGAEEILDAALARLTGQGDGGGA